MSQSEFQEYRIIWQALPFNRRPKRVVFAKAKTELDAYALTRDWVERVTGLARSEFRIHGVYNLEPPPEGEVINGRRLFFSKGVERVAEPSRPN